MNERLITSVAWIVMSIIGVAIVAVLVSKQSSTAGVLGSIGTELSCSIGTAVSPITGAAGCSPNVTSNISY